jgi:hypothetical protein
MMLPLSYNSRRSVHYYTTLMVVLSLLKRYYSASRNTYVVVLQFPCWHSYYKNDATNSI